MREESTLRLETEVGRALARRQEAKQWHNRLSGSKKIENRNRVIWPHSGFLFHRASSRILEGAISMGINTSNDEAAGRAKK
jgi:outer membrane protein assembly factor BamA